MHMASLGADIRATIPNEEDKYWKIRIWYCSTHLPTDAWWCKSTNWAIIGSGNGLRLDASFGGKPLPETRLTHYQLDPQEKITIRENTFENVCHYLLVQLYQWGLSVTHEIRARCLSKCLPHECKTNMKMNHNTKWALSHYICATVAKIINMTFVTTQWLIWFHTSVHNLIQNVIQNHHL